MMQRAILKLYQPNRAQRRAHLSPHRFNVICFGRQSGKSTYAINKLLDCAWKKINGIYWYVGPTYRLANQMYDRVMFALRNTPGVVTYKTDSDLMIQLASGSQIWFKSGDNPGGLLGETLDGCVIDECREQSRAIWRQYIMPMLGTTKGWCDFLSTPNGMDWFYDLYQNHLTKKNWGAFHAPSTCNPLWSEEMLEEARSEMSEDLYAQEILAEFRTMGEGACYVTFGDHNINPNSPFARGNEIISPYLPILVGMDFNIANMAWVLGQSKGRDIYFHDEIFRKKPNQGESATESAAKELVQKVKDHRPGVVLIGDASGKAGSRNAQAGDSDYDTIKGVLRAAGIPYSDKTPDSNPPLKDRVNNVNSAHKSADGSVHTWYHPRCVYTIKDRRRRKWKEGSTKLAFDTSDPEIGHISDAADYPICVLSPIKPIGNVGQVRIITRSV